MWILAPCRYSVLRTSLENETEGTTYKGYGPKSPKCVSLFLCLRVDRPVEECILPIEVASIQLQQVTEQSTRGAGTKEQSISAYRD